MEEELESLRKNHMCKLTNPLKNQKVILYKCVLKKVIPSVKKKRFKTKMVAKTYTQVEKNDYDEIFLHVV